MDVSPSRKSISINKELAERVGFEPTLPIRVNTLSKRAPSATRPSLRVGRNDSYERSHSPRIASKEAFFSILWVMTLKPQPEEKRYRRYRKVGEDEDRGTKRLLPENLRSERRMPRTLLRTLLRRSRGPLRPKRRRTMHLRPQPWRDFRFQRTLAAAEPSYC